MLPLTVIRALSLILLNCLFNSCLEHGSVPPSFNSGYVMPLLKKPDLDAADVKSYQPITNLSVISKLLERLVARQMVNYLTNNGLLPDLHSADLVRHSTDCVEGHCSHHSGP